MNWLAENWFWVVIGIVFVAMHLFGHGGHGSSGTDGSGSTKGNDQPGHRH